MRNLVKNKHPLMDEAVTQAVSASFDPDTGVLSVSGDDLDNTIAASRDAAGNILINGGAVDGTPTVANTTKIQMFGKGGRDILSLDEANGPLPRAFLFGGAGRDVLTGGSGADQLFGQSGNDTLLGSGGTDLLFGGDGNDILRGGDGDDQMFGQGGNDLMVWNPGDDSDLVEGGAGTDTARVNGGNAAEVFTATANGPRVRFDRLDPAPFALDIGTTENLVVNMNGGNDSFSATGNLAALIQITVDGGTGNDTILGSNGTDVLLGGDGDDFVDGQQGNDTARLGAGDDIFQWDPGDASDVVEGQDGVDTMLFNGSNAPEMFEASANGGRVLFTRDVGNIVMDLNDVERIELNALGSADTVTVNDLSGTDMTEIAIDLAGTLGGSAGDGQIDMVIARGTEGDDAAFVFGSGTTVSVDGLAATVTVDNAEAANDRLVINMGAGDDVVDASGLDAGLLGLTLEGGAGDDVLIGSPGDDILDGGDGDDVLIGGGGNDVFLNGEAIQDFQAGADKIDLTRIAGENDFDWAMAHAQDIDGNVVFDFGTGEQMKLVGVSSASLHADDFLL